MQCADAQAGAENWPSYDAASGVPPIRENEIHLWRTPLDIAPDRIVTLENILSPDERERAARFRFPEHRARFIAARGALRRILGIHLGHNPQSLRFAYGEHGKPTLAEPADTCIEFNISHSADLAVYAISIGCRVGVDVEFIKPDGSWMKIAEHYFSPDESARLSTLPEIGMRQAFFELWAEKEARMKALGVGLRFPLDKVDGSKEWLVIKFNPMKGYAAALACESQGTPPVIVKHHFAT